jgi:hypothetical protein
MNTPKRDNFDDVPILAEFGELLERRAFASDAQPGPDHARAVRSRSRWPHGRVSLSAAIAGGCALAVLIVIALIGHRGAVGTHSAQPEPAGLEAAFVVLRRAPEPRDGLPAQELFALSHSHAFHTFGLQPSRSRFLIATDAVTVWLVPGSKQWICLVARIADRRPRQGPGTSIACSSNRGAERQGMIGFEGNTVVGLLPDGSSGHVEVTGRDGPPKKVTLTEGAFAFRYSSSQLPISVYYTGPTGSSDHFLLDFGPAHGR